MFKDTTLTPVDQVHKVIGKYMLADGFEIIFDTKNSYRNKLVDARNGDKYIDFFTFFASSPLGINHPKLDSKEVKEILGEVAVNKPSNSDIYTKYMADFVATFGRIAKPDYMKYLFFISGGALAVENGLKVAFDWKVQKNFQKGIKEEKGYQVLHFKEAFHGRSGYTLSLTNTDPVKIKYFPKFNWPRVTNPKVTFPLNDHLDEIIELEKNAINEIKTAIKNNPDDIAVIIIEPIQGEGGDNFFRKYHRDCPSSRKRVLFSELWLLYQAGRRMVTGPRAEKTRDDYVAGILMGLSPAQASIHAGEIGRASCRERV